MFGATLFTIPQSIQVRSQAFSEGKGASSGHLSSPELRLRKTCKPLKKTVSQDSNDGYFAYWVNRFLHCEKGSYRF